MEKKKKKKQTKTKQKKKSHRFKSQSELQGFSGSSCSPALVFWTSTLPPGLVVDAVHRFGVYHLVALSAFFFSFLFVGEKIQGD